MASIAALALKLTADATDLVGTLEKVQRKVAGFTAGLTTKFAQPFRLITNPFASLEAGLGSFFELTGEGSQIKKIADTARAADKLGTSTETLIAIARAAKVEVADITPILFRASGAMGKMGHAADEVTTPLEKFGIDTKKIAASLDPIEAEFLAVADAIKEGGNAAEIAMAAYGKGGVGMVEALKKGKAGFEELKAAGKIEGTAFSREDAQRALDAVAATAKLKRSFEGIKTQLALAFAPVITEIADGIKSWIDRMGGGKAIAQAIAGVVFDIAITIAKIAATIEGMIVDTRNFISETDVSPSGAANLFRKKGLQALLPKEAGLGLDVIFGGGGGAEKAERGSFLPNLIKQLEEAKKSAADIGKDTGPGFWDWAKPFIREQELAIARQKELKAVADDLATKLGQEADAFGLTGAAAEIYKLKLQGASDATLEAARTNADFLAQLEDNKKLRDFGKSVEEEILTPVEKWSLRMGDLQAALEEGAISMTTFGRASVLAGQQLLATQQGPAGPGALLAGTSAALSAINADFQRGQTERNPFKLAEQLLAQQLAVQRQQLEELRRQAAEAGLVLPDVIAP